MFVHKCLLVDFKCGKGLIGNSHYNFTLTLVGLKDFVFTNINHNKVGLVNTIKEYKTIWSMQKVVTE